MQEATRRAALAAAGTLGGISLATLLLLRKPGHPVLMRPAQALPALHGIDGLDATAPARPMPPIRFADAGGRPHTLRDFSGSGVVLNLWATWCAPCVAEMPSLAALARRLAGSGVTVLPLSIDRGGAATVRAFYADNHIDGLGIWTDADGQAEQALRVDGVPTTFIVDRHGRQVARLEGATDWGSDAAARAGRGLVG